MAILLLEKERVIDLKGFISCLGVLVAILMVVSSVSAIKNKSVANEENTWTHETEVSEDNIPLSVEAEVEKQEKAAQNDDKEVASSNTTNKEETSVGEEEEPKKEKKKVSDGKFEYEVPESAPWWSPVSGGDIDSKNIQKGENGQVSTIVGNGTQGQSARQLDTPRQLAVSPNKQVYFIDGSSQDAKIRKFDGKKNVTVVDLMQSQIVKREGEFMSTGLNFIGNTLYVSDINNLYKVTDGRINSVGPAIKDYMEKHNFAYIFRTEKYKNYIYLMLESKSYQFSIIRYNVNTGKIEQVVEQNTYPDPYNFYVNGENEIFIACSTGYIVWEQLHPRQTIDAFVHADPSATSMADVWIGKDDDMYMMAWEEGVKNILYRDPKGGAEDEVHMVMGDRRGFVDGYQDEVEMDGATDFVWDGSGYVFADTNNHAIRKLWYNVGPMH